jgi:[ribosomal protein S18]-alanine N-acetyltransferase
VQVRRANVADVPAMMNLERESVSAGHWSREQYESLFLAADQHVKNHEARSGAFAWVIENEPVDTKKVAGQRCELLAFLVAHRVDAEWELENMAVAVSVRGRGIGTLLLRELIGQARVQGGSKIFLEVRASNQSARSLYEKFGFEEAGLRKSYYSDPTEDAILYQLICRS